MKLPKYILCISINPEFTLTVVVNGKIDSWHGSHGDCWSMRIIFTFIASPLPSTLTQEQHNPMLLI